MTALQKQPIPNNQTPKPLSIIRKTKRKIIMIKKGSLDLMHKSSSQRFLTSSPQNIMHAAPHRAFPKDV